MLLLEYFEVFVDNEQFILFCEDIVLMEWNLYGNTLQRELKC